MPDIFDTVEQSTKLARPQVNLGNGQIGTVRSIGVGNEKGEYVIPTIVKGVPYSNEDAIKLWQSGSNQPLAGPFTSQEEATRYAEDFHKAEEFRISNPSDIFDQVSASDIFDHISPPSIGDVSGGQVSLLPPTPNQAYQRTTPGDFGYHGFMQPIVQPEMIRDPQTIPEGLVNTVGKGVASLSSPFSALLGMAGPVKALQPILTGGLAGLGAQGVYQTLKQPSPQNAGQATEQVGDILQNLLMVAPALAHFTPEALPSGIEAKDVKRSFADIPFSTEKQFRPHENDIVPPSRQLQEGQYQQPNFYGTESGSAITKPQMDQLSGGELVALQDAIRKNQIVVPQETPASKPVFINPSGKEPITKDYTGFTATVQPDEVPGSGYVQMDEHVNGKNTRSVSREDLETAGYVLPPIEELKALGGGVHKIELQKREQEQPQTTVGHDLKAAASAIKYGIDKGTLSKEQSSLFQQLGDSLFAEMQKGRDVSQEAKALYEDVKGVNQKYGETPSGKVYGGLFFLDPDFWKSQVGVAENAKTDAKMLYNRIRNKLGEASSAWKAADSEEFRAFMVGKRSPEEVQKWLGDNGPKVEVKKFAVTDHAKESSRLSQLEHSLDTAGITAKYNEEGDTIIGWQSNGKNVRPSDMQSPHATDMAEFESLYNSFKSVQDTGHAHWQSIAPKDESSMPGYTEIAVVKPMEAHNASKPYGQKFPSSHNFPPNTLGFSRGYMETLPNGKKVFHVIEVQSDWEQKVRDDITERRLQGGKEGTKPFMTPSDPLLPHYERLALKAAIEHAREQGADYIAISDAETAMMTEGHDRQEMYHMPKEESSIRQSAGMRLHYDQTLPKIASELTGSKGEKVSFGEHKMAFDLRERAMEEGGNAPQRGPRKDLIFKDSSGKPKTDVSATMFPIEKAKKDFSLFGKDKPVEESPKGKMYSAPGMMFDPDFYKKTAKDLKQGFGEVMTKLNNDREKLERILQSRPNRDLIVAKRDAVDTATFTTAIRAENHINLVAKKLFGANSEKARNAVVAALEAKGDKSKLGSFLSLAQKDPRAVEAIKFAQQNWEKLQPILENVKAIDQMNLDMAKKAGVFIPSIDDYIKRSYETGEKGFFFNEKGEPGIGAASKIPRQFPNVFAAIEAGHKPLSLDAAALVGKRTSEIQMEINQKMWVDAFRKYQDKAGSPIVADLVKAKGTTTRVPPEGYERAEILPGYPVAVLKDYRSIFDALTAKSRISGSLPGQAALQTVGAVKHGLLAIDSFHAFRLYQFRKALGLKGTYKNGLSLLEYSKADIDEAVKQGQIPESAKQYVNEKVKVPQGEFSRYEIASKGVSNGLLVARHSEALYTSFVRSFPVLKQTVGAFNRFVFDKLSRGAIMEGFQIEFERVGGEHPEWSADIVARKVAKDINFRMGNVSRQGIFKSRQMQDLMQLAFLAPRWVESMAQSEARSVMQFGKAAIPGKDFGKLGTLAKSTGNLLAAYIVGTQALNYITTGHSTLENEKGHRLDAYVPPTKDGGKGFWISPLSVAAELSHDIYRYSRTEKDAAAVGARIVGNKMSPLLRAEEVLRTGKDWKGTELEGFWNKAKEAAITAVDPTPLPVKQGIKSFKEGDVTSAERQAFAMVGVKAEPETTTEVRQRQSKDQTLDQRYAQSQQSKSQERKDLSPSEKAQMVARSVQQTEDRRKEIIRGLSNESKQFVEKNHLSPISYQGWLSAGPRGQKERIYLTEEELKTLQDKLVAKYNGYFKDLSSDKEFETLPQGEKDKIVRKDLSKLKQEAESEMEDEMSKPKEKKKKFSIFNPE